jgi:poly(3-hydroxybutyrate) depolymerase
MPIIVFHGDEDATVHPFNGEQAWRRAINQQGTIATESGRVRTYAEVSDRGRRYTRTVATNAAGHVVAEHWLIHGAGHAWAGGNSAGSYTDSSGPNASAEMIRFFMDHPHADRH